MTNPDPAPLPSPETMSEAYVRYVPDARALPAGEYKPCRADLRVAYANLQAGLAALAPCLPSLRARMPGENFGALETLPGYCLATIHAAALCDAIPDKQRARTEHLARARELREPLVTIAEGLGQLGLLPREQVAGIRAGHGYYDLGEDLLALVGLYRAHAAELEHKHPFSVAYLAESAQVGEWLTTHITPQGALPPEDVDRAARAADRDRLWELVKRGYEVLWQCAVAQWGTAAGEHVRELQSHAGHRPKAA